MLQSYAQFSQKHVSQWLKNEALQVAEVGVEAMLHCAIFSATCLAMLLGTKNKKCAHTPLLKLP